MTRNKAEYIKNWLFRANEDIAVIKSLANDGAEFYTSSICFHAQQASEKFLKAFLAYHDVDFPRTHDLDFLLLECQKINKDAFQIDQQVCALLMQGAHNGYVPWRFRWCVQV